MRFATTLTVALVLASLGVVPAIADTVTLGSSADALGMQGSPNTNYPSTNPWGDVMWTRWDGSATKFWVKFDLSSIQGTATSATLNVTRIWGATGGDDAVLVGSLKDGDLGEGWGETSLTYNNAPGNVLNDYPLNWGAGGNVTYVGGITYSATGGVGDVLTLTGADLLAAVNGDTNHSLTLGFTKRGYDADAAGFASRTNTFYAGPTLVLTGVTTVPEPSTLILLYTALAGLLAYAWRKRK